MAHNIRPDQFQVAYNQEVPATIRSGRNTSVYYEFCKKIIDGEAENVCLKFSDETMAARAATSCNSYIFSHKFPLRAKKFGADMYILPRPAAA